MARRFYPNETDEYRKARDQLLDEEETLRMHTERVAELRRALPVGGEVKQDYVFKEWDGEGGSRDVRLSELFVDEQQSLLIYGFMYGPDMKAACPLCTSFLDALDGQAPHIAQRMSLAVSARSPIERILDHAASRGWTNLRLISSAQSSFQHDYLAEGDDGSQLPMANVFVRRDGRVHHFWGSELFHRPFPSGNSRHIDILWPLWNVLDLTPEGRGDSWYPALQY